VDYVNQSGEPEHGTGGIRGWLRTGADGLARAGVGRGAIAVRLASGEWAEERTIEVSSPKPQDIDFNRGSQPDEGQDVAVIRPTRID
jgi:hypothetical protein